MPRTLSVLLLALALCCAAAAPAEAKRDKGHKGEKGQKAEKAEKPEKADDQSIRAPYVVVLRDRLGDPTGATNDKARRLGFLVKHQYVSAVRGFAAQLNDHQAARLAEDRDVEMIVPDASFAAAGTAALVAGEQAPPGIRRIGAAAPGTASIAASGAVAVLDTGIDLAHPDLVARHGVNCITPSAQAKDDNGHGTHVAGIIGARNAGRDVVGVAPGTTLYSVKVLNARKTGTLSQLICGIDWVARNAAALGITTANMSISGTGSDDGQCGRANKDAQHVAVCNLVAAGVTMVASAGNSGRGFGGTIPAAYREVLTATAMNDADGAPGARGTAFACKTSEKDDRFATYSNFGVTAADAAHTIAAPGTCVASSKPGGGTVLFTGTSQAAPHVAGAVAACRSQGAPCEGLAPAAVIAKMRDRGLGEVGVGFAGDPSAPVTGKVFGPLVSGRS